ncbi:MAG: phosphatase PAP2 family protein [Alphaproteobacteria bacterium]|nr:phosphatase PAP2 family protein [Alphaproteobacteria bacterium]
MTIDTNKSERIKLFIKKAKETASAFFAFIFSHINRFIHSKALHDFIVFFKWPNLRLHLLQAKKIIVDFTEQQPKTACFIYVCLFCSFSIAFLDEPFALIRLKSTHQGLFSSIVALNPAGWWFLFLAALWLFYMAVAGLSLTTEVFEKNLVKARSVLFVLLALSLSSFITLFLNVLTGRYSPEFLDTMNLYGFSALRFRVSETSFPSFDVQSAWVVALAAGSQLPRFKRWFYFLAGLVTLSVVVTAESFISDAVMGMYIGIVMYYAASWIVSEKRENFPLISS